VLLDRVVEKDDGGYVLRSALAKPSYNKLRPLMSMKKEREIEATKSVFSRGALDGPIRRSLIIKRRL